MGCGFFNNFWRNHRIIRPAADRTAIAMKFLFKSYSYIQIKGLATAARDAAAVTRAGADGTRIAGLLTLASGGRALADLPPVQ